MKYLVMECRPAWALVLGEDGTFHRVVNLHYEVGQTVTDVVPLKIPEQTPAPAARRPGRWVSTLAAMAACLVIAMTGLLFSVQRPCASVYMTINPQVRIDVNRYDRVLTVRGMNPDGRELLRGYDSARQDLDTVMDDLVDRAIDMGYLHEGGTVTLSLDGSEEWVLSHKSHLDTHLTDHLTHRIDVTVDVDTQPPRQQAPVPAPTDPIVIPVGPGSYGESDYEQPTGGDESTAEHPSGGTQVPGTLPQEDGDSDYEEEPEEGLSDYEGMTDYEDRTEEEADSGYEDGEQEDPDYGSGQEEEADSGYEDDDDEDDDEDGDEDSDYGDD